MAYNPFLSMGEALPPPASTADISNPFMMATDDSMPVDYSSDNPFAASNPFSDFGGPTFEAAVTTAAMDIFGFESTYSTSEIDKTPKVSENIFSTAPEHYAFSKPNEIIKPTQLDLTTNLIDTTIEEELSKPSRPPPPPPSRPVPPETKNLILSVTGQMDSTSSHLLDRIPPTRTPSPISMRDLNTPEPEQDDSFPEEESLEANTMEPMIPVSAPAKPEMNDTNTSKPSRPARPPPRPAPPPIPRPPLPKFEPKPEPQSEEINLFDAPTRAIPPKPTKESILSLYSSPKNNEEAKPVDFLSDDINQDQNSSSNSNNQTVIENEPSDNVGSDEFSQHEISPNDKISDVTDGILTTNGIPTTENSGTVFQNNFENKELADNSVNKTYETKQTVDSFGFDQHTDPKTNPFESLNTSIDTASFSPFDMKPTVPIRKPSIPMETVFEHDNQIPETINDVEYPVEDHMPFPAQEDQFDAFSAKFDSTTKSSGGDAWGSSQHDLSSDAGSGFENEQGFDEFLLLKEPPPVPSATPFSKADSMESDDGTFNVIIRPKAVDSGFGDTTSGEYAGAAVPQLAPPPRPAAYAETVQSNPFGTAVSYDPAEQSMRPTVPDEGEKKSGSESPQTPLFDDDVSQPLEDFPRTTYDGPGWEMQLRQPNKKKITGQRFWKKIFVKLTYQNDNPVVQLYNTSTDKEPFQELPLQACYSVSEISAQQYDQYGKIFTIKLQYIFYKERPGVRPGQVTKAERITNKLSQFAAYAIQGDYQGVKEFGSDLKKLGLPVEHAPQISQLFKIGSLNYEDVKQFSVCIEELLFRLSVHRDRALHYKFEEVQITAVDELYAEQDFEGSVTKQIARVRLFFLGFLCGMPDVEVGVNDLRRQGREVVGRHDIIPVVTEEWIRVENAEFHSCVQAEEFLNTQLLRFKPPDACYIELMRFRIRPPKNRELPLQLKAVMCVTGNKVELRADVLVPGFASRKLGQIPCEDVMIRFPIPECWIYLFRVEKHFRYGSVKSAHRRTGKIKGIERFLGAMETLQESLIEVTSGQAKYEHQHRAIVWRMPRLPKEGQGAYTTHNLVCRMALTSYDQIPAQLSQYAYVEFTMPHTQVSHMTVRSVSLQNHDSDEPPEKYVRYLARHEYVVGIEHTTGSTTGAYVSAAAVPTPKPEPSQIQQVPSKPPSDSDSDSD